MKIDVFVSSLQVEDFGASISVGDRLPVELIGYWGGALGQEVQSLPSFQGSHGRETLRRIGLVEYAFCGKILACERLANFGADGLTYTEVLVDCGVPVVLVTHGVQNAFALNLDEPKDSGISLGRYLSGLMLLNARISFRYPSLIERELNSIVLSISLLDLSPSSAVLGEAQHVKFVNGRHTKMPVILGLELQGQ